MVITSINAGLGNQLFQYAFGYHLALINNTVHKIDTSNYKDLEPNSMNGVRLCGLEHFNITAKKASAEEIQKFNFYTKNKIGRKLLRLYSNQKNYYKRSYLMEPEKNYFRFDPRALNHKHAEHIYVDGYWQSEKYFKDIEEHIRKEFSFKKGPDKVNAKIIEEMEKINSVSIHVRHGDNTKMMNGVLPLDYYYRAAKKMALSVDQPVFYVFSDDPEWAEANVKLNNKTIYISHNGDKKNHEDLRLMTHCKHHILGNSTFSWWGAWLGKKEGQIVFSPKSHHSYPDLTSSDYIPQGWTFI